MPVDTNLTPDSFNPGSGVNPLGVVNSVVDIQNKLANQKLLANQNAIFQQQFQAKQEIGKIFAKHPGDEQGAMSEVMSSPYAAWAPDVASTIRSATLAGVQIQGEQLKQGTTALQAATSTLGVGLNDVRMLPAAKKAADKIISTQPQNVKDAWNSLYDSVTAGQDFNSTDPAVLANNQKLFQSKAAGILAGVGGMPPDTFNGVTGNLPATRTTGNEPTNTTPATLPSLARPGPGNPLIPGAGVTSAASPQSNPLAAAANISTAGVTSAQPVAGAGASAGAAAAPIAGNGKPLVVEPGDLPPVTRGDNGKISYPSPQYAKAVDDAQTEWQKEKPQYEAAAQSIARLNDAKAEIQTLALKGGLTTPGAAGELRANLGNVINTFSSIFRPSEAPPVDVTAQASAQDLMKNTINLGFQLAHSQFGGGREPLGIVDNALAAVPGISNSPLGGMMVSDVLSAGAKWMLDKQQFKQQVFDKTGGNLTGADSKFIGKYPPSEYLAPVMAKYGIKPDGSGFESPAAISKLYSSGLINGQQLYDQSLRQGFISKKVYDAAKARDFTPPGATQ